jgi:hypothetical protein
VDPPVGSVDVTAFPSLSTATHIETDGQATPFKLANGPPLR